MATKVLNTSYKNVLNITKCPRHYFRRCSMSNKKAFEEKSKSSGSTVDNDEIQLFSEMKDWWNLNGPMKPLHAMNTLRIPFIREGVIHREFFERKSLSLAGKEILDVGCGGGILSEGLARLGAKVTGIDASKTLIKMAEEHKTIDPKIANNQPSYHITTIEEHVVNNANKYDAVVASEVIEHVNNKELFVKSCIQATKPGCRIFFTTPNRTPASRIFCIYLAEYVCNMLPKGTHQYDKFITPNELTFLLERNGCHVECVFGTFYHVLTNRWEFINSQALMYALQAVRLE